MSDKHYVWVNQSNGAWVDTEEMRKELVDDGVLVPVDSIPPVQPDCWRCQEKAIKERADIWPVTQMILCPSCGNKRCPKATDHTLACTKSNKPGQTGSVYA